MSNEKVKSENYKNFSGINAKFSLYNLGPTEFLDLTNLDFQTPGALSQRWGTTNYIGATSTFAGPVTGLFEFNRISGFSQMVFGYTGALFTESAGTISGVSTGPIGATLVGLVTFPSVFYNTGGGAWQTAYSQQISWANNPALRMELSGSGTSYATFTIGPQAFAGNRLDGELFKDHLFLANGNMFAKFNGQSLYRANLPYAFTSVSNQTGSGGANYSLDLNKTYVIGTAFLSVTGEEGPILPAAQIVTIAGGGSYAQLSIDTIVPLGFGITAVNVYVNEGATTSGYGSWNFASNSAWTLPFYFYKSVPITAGATVVSYDIGAASDPKKFNGGDLRFFGDNITLGLTITPSVGGTFSKLDYRPFCPKFVEQFQNHLFLAGFTGSASTVVFTDLATGEVISPDSNFEVRTNDGDEITGLKNYGQRLMIGKNFSLHQVTGDSPENFTLAELSKDYGFYNNRCSTTYGDLFAFLDRKGIIGYNGAQLSILSFKIQDIIDRINQAAAVTHACMGHDKARNLILIGVPLDGATLNNYTLVFDYISNAWTKYNGFSPEVFLQAKGSLQSRALFYGGYSGQIAYFGASFTQDPGSGFTMSLKSRFIQDMGDSVQKQFRYLYMNIEPPSATLTIPINFYQDYGASKVLRSTLVISRFQDRLDFGISAKSVAFDFAQVSTNVPFKFYGFTLEERLQRRDGSR